MTPAEDVSGMACTPADGGRRLCLLVDDETQGAQVVILDDGARTAKPGQYIPLVRHEFAGKPLELDAEGAAYADGSFYVLGSHGRPRHEKEGDEEKNQARQAASSHLFRIRFARDAVDMNTGAIRSAPAVIESAPLSDFLPAGSLLKRQVGVPLETNGMTVEGFTVRGRDGIVGFRGPVDGSEALLLEVPLSDLFGGAGRVGAGRTVCLGVDGRGAARGIRDLAGIGDAVYGIAGPVHDPAEEAATADYAVFRLAPEGGVTLLPLPDRTATVKPEALVPLAGGGSGFDGLMLHDGASYGTPPAPTFLAVSFDFAAGEKPSCAPERQAR
ncbi:DUF3616 domain-containing protein [Sphingomonas sp. A2-49]|uniref:DUF3616 domain-containing protein n=1 Tax=Sphingomonas sp. A2-49 TaxID=1391375 RepID=UPI0021CF35AC|nr:DUF3616 domain-containing protein [Sphingomonas sp. A2-49]MCU6456019.1 DUF3616 domain-containing protein [Sphingomonas sp. A2-49]